MTLLIVYGFSLLVPRLEEVAAALFYCPSQKRVLHPEDIQGWMD